MRLRRTRFAASSLAATRWPASRHSASRWRPSGRGPITRIRLVRGARVIETALPFPAAGLSRRTLDPALLDTAEAAGATVLRGHAVRRLDGAAFGGGRAGPYRGRDAVPGHRQARIARRWAPPGRAGRGHGGLQAAPDAGTRSAPRAGRRDRVAGVPRHLCRAAGDRGRPGQSMPGDAALAAGGGRRLGRAAARSGAGMPASGVASGRGGRLAEAAGHRARAVRLRPPGRRHGRVPAGRPDGGDPLVHRRRHRHRAAHRPARRRGAARRPPGLRLSPDSAGCDPWSDPAGRRTLSGRPIAVRPGGGDGSGPALAIGPGRGSPHSPAPGEPPPATAPGDTRCRSRCCRR